MGVKIYLKKMKEDTFCEDCYFDQPTQCGNAFECCTLEGYSKSYIKITESEFNASSGRKYRANRRELLPYEDKLYLHINGEKYPVFPDDTAEDIEKRINDDLEYAEITIIMDDKK